MYFPWSSCLGRVVAGTRSATELASLGPATVLCESLIYCSTFLAIAVTNLQATALADGKRAEAQKVPICSLSIEDCVADRASEVSSRDADFGPGMRRFASTIFACENGHPMWLSVVQRSVLQAQQTVPRLLWSPIHCHAQPLLETACRPLHPCFCFQEPQHEDCSLATRALGGVTCLLPFIVLSDRSRCRLSWSSPFCSAVCLVPKVVAQALGLALAIGLAVGMGVQVFGPTMLVHLAGEKSKEVRNGAMD